MPCMGCGWCAAGSDKGTCVSGDMVFLIITPFTSCFMLLLMKSHCLLYSGRGIWRCLYDPNSSLLVTAGFDSAIKVHQLHSCGSEILLDTVGVLSSQNKVESFSTCLPNATQSTGLMDR